MIFHFKQKSPNLIPTLKLEIDQIPIERVSTFNFLGIEIEETLSWHPHTEKIKLKLNRTIGVLRRLKSTLSSLILKTLYNSLILPHLQYGLLLWGSHLSDLVKPQKTAIRVVHKSAYRAHTEPLFKNLKLLKIDDLYIMTAVKFFYKYQKENLPLYFLNIFKGKTNPHTHGTRNRFVERPNKPIHSTLESCPRYLIPKTVKNLPEIITNKLETHSLNGISNYLKNYLLSKYSLSCSIDNCFICATQY